mmetsp:Transcript_5940/g.16998  ORF Transcript_5940/g.16998 Transcript_5940/m.16998 type:complete len:210 (+) Transcript_5940:1275-1904(+)
MPLMRSSTSTPVPSKKRPAASSPDRSTTRVYPLVFSTPMMSSRLSAARLGHFMGYSTRVFSLTAPLPSPAAWVLNQLLGNTASGVPCPLLCCHRLTSTPATSVSWWCSPANSRSTFCVSVMPSKEEVVVVRVPECMKWLSCAVCSLNWNAVGATIITSLVDCLEADRERLEMVLLYSPVSASLTSGTWHTRTPSLYSSLSRSVEPLLRW